MSKGLVLKGPSGMGNSPQVWCGVSNLRRSVFYEQKPRTTPKVFLSDPIWNSKT